MCNIIQQIDPLLNPHVIASNYHFVDPHGNVILPRLWDAVIQDGMTITMRPKVAVAIPPGM
jgi:hypothetical protein